MHTENHISQKIHMTLPIMPKVKEQIMYSTALFPPQPHQPQIWEDHRFMIQMQQPYSISQHTYQPPQPIQPRMMNHLSQNQRENGLVKATYANIQVFELTWNGISHEFIFS